PHTLRVRSGLGSGIAMIALNRAMDFYRGTRETVDLPSDLAGADRQRVPEAKEVLNMICRLPDAYRETLVLRLVEGMTGPEIALRTGLTAASGRVNLHRGMKLLSERLGLKEGLGIT